MIKTHVSKSKDSVFFLKTDESCFHSICYTLNLINVVYNNMYVCACSRVWPVF